MELNKVGPSSNAGAAASAMTDPDIIDEALIEIATSVGDCVTTQGEVCSTLNDHSDKLTESEKEIQELKVKNNIVIEGVPEVEGENCIAKACDIFKIIENKCQAEDIISAYRIGQKSDKDAYIRPIVVKMMDPLVKLVLMEKKGKLKNHDQYGYVFLNDDLPPKMKNERKVLREICKYAHSIGYKGCKTSGGKLVINGRSYRYDTIHLLPQELQMCNIKTRLVGDGLGFQGEESYLSNFYPATLTIEQMSFSSAEQAYQYFKARASKRDDMADKILGMSNPRKIKLAGDEVDTLATWEQDKEAFLRSVVYSKFNQNEELRKKLLDTGDIPIYECTKNRYWGCGLRLDAPEWQSKIYPGLNKMGAILSSVRAALRKVTHKEDAARKSPGMIIRSMKAMDKLIQNRCEGATAPDEGLDPEQPVIKPVQPEQSYQVRNELEMDYNDDGSTTTDAEELMGETDIDEESVNISASSSISNTVPKQTRKTSRLDVTDSKGKLDISKIKNWSIPKLNKSGQSRESTTFKDRTRSQPLSHTLPSTSELTNKDGLPVPQAQSTPHQRKANRSLTLEMVREKLKPLGERK